MTTASPPTTTAALPTHDPTHDPTHSPTHLLVELALLQCVDLLILTSFVEPEPLGVRGVSQHLHTMTFSAQSIISVSLSNFTHTHTCTKHKHPSDTT